MNVLHLGDDYHVLCRYDYFDPPDRSQGTSFDVNGSFEGVLGLLWERVR